jgi:hypothetical protein
LPAATSSPIAPTDSSIGHLGIHTVQVEQLDTIGAEVAQRAFQGAADVVRATVEAEHLPVVGDLHAGLGGDDHGVAAANESLAQELLVEEGAVAFCGV